MFTKDFSRPLMRQGWKSLLMAMVVTLGTSACGKDDYKVGGENGMSGGGSSGLSEGGENALSGLWICVEGKRVREEVVYNNKGEEIIERDTSDRSYRTSLLITNSHTLDWEDARNGYVTKLKFTWSLENDIFGYSAHLEGLKNKEIYEWGAEEKYKILYSDENCIKTEVVEDYSTYEKLGGEPYYPYQEYHDYRYSYSPFTFYRLSGKWKKVGSDETLNLVLLDDCIEPDFDAHPVNLGGWRGKYTTTISELKFKEGYWGTLAGADEETPNGWLLYYRTINLTNRKENEDSSDEDQFNVVFTNSNRLRLEKIFPNTGKTIELVRKGAVNY